VIVQVQYRIDAHDYLPAEGRCAASCRACRLESVPYRSEEAAEAAQPVEERRLDDGDQGSVNPPARRFSVIVRDLFG
jgi:hypothetical protein